MLDQDFVGLIEAIKIDLNFINLIFMFSSTSENAEAIEPTPGPSVEQSRPKSLIEQLKDFKVAKALDAKNLAKLSPAQKKHLAELRQKKQVGNFRIPDAPEPKKGKGKVKDRKEDTRVWGSCPLLGVPTVPPPHVPQLWELQRSHDSVEEEEDDVIEGTPPDIIIPQRMFAGSKQSAGTPPPTAPSVLAEIEFLGFSPSSTTSTTAPGSGRSAYELGVDVDVERNFIEPEEGSDVEHEENLVDFSLKARTVGEYLVDSDSLPDPSLAEALRSIDAEADLALRTVIGPGSDQDLLSFDWRCEQENLRESGKFLLFRLLAPLLKTRI
ncbi:hypothetical protein SFRURICE_003911 [Spodoptera frugiperda]|nr:hypothetical protein SFRURICE_003911 [Spodoptera frugiperda]